MPEPPEAIGAMNGAGSWLWLDEVAVIEWLYAPDIPRKRLMHHSLQIILFSLRIPFRHRWEGGGSACFETAVAVGRPFSIRNHELTLYRNQGLMPKLPDL